MGKKAKDVFGFKNNAAYSVISRGALSGFSDLKNALQNKKTLSDDESLSAEDKSFLEKCDCIHIMVGLRNYSGNELFKDEDNTQTLRNGFVVFCRHIVAEGGDVADQLIDFIYKFVAKDGYIEMFAKILDDDTTFNALADLGIIDILLDKPGFIDTVKDDKNGVTRKVADIENLKKYSDGRESEEKAERPESWKEKEGSRGSRSFSKG